MPPREGLRSSIDALRDNGSVLRRRRAPRRQAYGADVRQSAGMSTHIPDAARAGLRAAAYFETMNSSDEVVAFLQEMDLRRYEQAFRTHAVTGKTLLSLTSAELRDCLGVQRLSDRRIILDGIAYLEEALAYESRMVLPEDGRILTHLSNDALFLDWLRLSILLQTTAVGTIGYVDVRSQASYVFVVLASFITCIVGIAVSVYAFHRYYWMHRMIDFPGHDFLPDNVNALTPGLVISSFSIILSYAVMSQDTDEAALMLLLSI
jgi:uncharacterized membrane protein YidH (DUF202 family)